MAFKIHKNTTTKELNKIIKKETCMNEPMHCKAIKTMFDYMNYMKSDEEFDNTFQEILLKMKEKNTIPEKWLENLIFDFEHLEGKPKATADNFVFRTKFRYDIDQTLKSLKQNKQFMEVFNSFDENEIYKI